MLAQDARDDFGRDGAVPDAFRIDQQIARVLVTTDMARGAHRDVVQPLGGAATPHGLEDGRATATAPLVTRRVDADEDPASRKGLAPHPADRSVARQILED